MLPFPLDCFPPAALRKLALAAYSLTEPFRLASVFDDRSDESGLEVAGGVVNPIANPRKVLSSSSSSSSHSSPGSRKVWRAARLSTVDGKLRRLGCVTLGRMRSGGGMRKASSSQ